MATQWTNQADSKERDPDTLGRADGRPGVGVGPLRYQRLG